MNNTLQKNQGTTAPVQKSVKSWITSEYFRQQVALVLPKHLTPERFTRIAITALNRTPKLALCTPESVMKCMMQCSELGLEPDGRRYHLIPFENNKTGKIECTGIIDYKGLVELAMNSGTVSSIFAQTICDADEFEYDTGEIHHKINFRQDRGTMYAVYVIITFKDGGKHTEVMTKPDVDRIRARSKSPNRGPWVTDYEEMAKKTVFRRASKWVKLSPEVMDALDREEPESDRALVQEISSAQMPAQSAVDGPTDLERSRLVEGGEPEPEPEPAPIDVPGRQTEPAQPEPAPDRKPQAPPEPAQQPAKPAQAAPAVNKVKATLQDSLAAFVEANGYTFSQLQKWGEESGNIPDGSSLPDFDSVPDDICRRLLRAQQGLLRGLAMVKGTV